MFMMNGLLTNNVSKFLKCLSVFALSHSRLQTIQWVDGVLVLCILFTWCWFRTGSWISLQSALWALTHARLPFLGASVIGGTGGAGRSYPHPPEGR